MNIKYLTLFVLPLLLMIAGCDLGEKQEYETSDAELIKHVNGLRNKINAKGILLTLSEKGIYFQKENAVYREKAHKRNIIDVSGAGDTVVSVAALALACNLEDDCLMRIANLAGGLVCEKVGVTPIQREDLLKANLV